MGTRRGWKRSRRWRLRRGSWQTGCLFCGSLELKNGLHPFCRALRCDAGSRKSLYNNSALSFLSLSRRFSLGSGGQPHPASPFFGRGRESIKYANGLVLCYGPRMYIFLIRNYYVDLCSQAENEKVQTGHPPPITVTLLTVTLRADVCTHWKALEYVKMFE